MRNPVYNPKMPELSEALSRNDDDRTLKDWNMIDDAARKYLFNSQDTGYDMANTIRGKLTAARQMITAKKPAELIDAAIQELTDLGRLILHH